MANGMFSISKLLDENIIYIPEIQRDYAQGRENAEVVRNKLLDDIYDVLHGSKRQLVLNYIYGVPQDDGKIILIDGQQRVAYRSELVHGLVVNPFGEFVRLDKKLLGLILKEYEEKWKTDGGETEWNEQSE